jgi:hypothetical protein
MDEDPNEPTLCRGCTKFTHRNLLFLLPDRGDQLGLCLQEDGVYSTYVTHKTKCPRYSQCLSGFLPSTVYAHRIIYSNFLLGRCKGQPRRESQIG